jgi:RNase P protein component
MLIGALACAPTARSIRCGGDGARRDLDRAHRRERIRRGTRLWFSQPRDAAAPARVVVATWLIECAEPVQRVSLSRGEALWLARILVRFGRGSDLRRARP